MRKLKACMMTVCALALLSVGVLADNHGKMLKEHFEFNSDVMIGSTHVKKGRYLVKYNDETGMMTVLDGNDHKKVIATAKATVKVNEKNFENDQVLTKTTATGEQLTGLRLGGQKEELTISEQLASSNQD